MSARQLPKASRIDSTDSPDRMRNLLIQILIAFVVLAVFWPVCRNHFLTWDDYQNIAANQRFNPPTIQGIAYFFTHPYLSLYIPLTYFIWGIIALISTVPPHDASGLRLDPSLFHAVNLLLHIVSALVVFHILNRLARRPWPAVAGALLFAIHPVQVEPVAWITGMKDVLAGMLTLFALWRYLAFAQGSQHTGDQTKSSVRVYANYAIALVAFALAMLAKPSAVAAPAMALVIDRWMVGRSWKKVIASVAPWVVLAVPIIFIATKVQPVDLHDIDGNRPWLRPLLATNAVTFYLYKIAMPIWLVPQYDHSAKAVVARGWVAWSWIAPVALVVIAIVFRKRLPWILASSLLLIAGLLPVLGLVPFGFEAFSLVADRYLYVAMLGPALALAFLVLRFGRHRGFAWTCAVWLAALGVWSCIQIFHWYDTQSLFSYELKVNPSSTIADHCLADAYLTAGDPAQALVYSRRLIDKQPRNAEGYFAAASDLAMLGRYSEALAAVRLGLSIEPENVGGLKNYAGLLAQQGNLEEAISVSHRILKVAPDDGQAHLNLGIILANAHQDDEAMDQLESAVRLDPGDSQAHTYLGILLLDHGQVDQAAQHLYTALQLDPENAMAKQGMARLGSQMRR
ncbi:MAG TPA: tetratricopeptide repeat protein [Tepidisphaeraceae bacterium]|nr:tetratricopeptide repeat protein [Tepidisphaeraceae bacterium]